MTSSRRSGDEVEAEHNAASSQGPPPASFPSVMEKEGDEAAPSTHVRGPAVEAGDAAQGVGKKKNKSLRKRAHAAAEAALQALLVDHKQTAAASKRVIMRRHRCGLPCLPLLEALDARMHKQALAVISAIKAHGVAMDALAAAHAAGGAAAPADAAAERARAVLQECVQEHRTILADIMAAVAKEEATAASADEPHAAVSPVRRIEAIGAAIEGEEASPPSCAAGLRRGRGRRLWGVTSPGEAEWASFCGLQRGGSSRLASERL